MNQIKKSTVLVVLVLLITAFVFYRYATKIISPKTEDEVPAVKELVAPKKEAEAPRGEKTVSAVATYTVPGDKVDEVRFILTLKDGVITDFSEVDNKTNKSDEHMVAFDTEISKIIVGKKLSDLKALDRVGKSTITTDAFNKVLPELQKQ